MSAPLISLQHVTAGYNHQPIFQDLTLSIALGQFAAIVGPTGAGKSTLLKTMLGLISYQRGTVSLLPQVTIGYVPQREVIDWQFPLTVEQVVLLGRYQQTNRFPWWSRTDRQQAALWLDRLGMTPYAKRHISQLSGGQQQRVFLARALIGNPQLLLLDEPTTGVDMKTQHEILHLLQTLNQEGMTILLTTHDLNIVVTHMPWVICFNHRIIAQGIPGEVFTPETLQHTYGADIRVLRQGDLTFIANSSLSHSHVSADSDPTSQPPRTP
jgi:zinc/manganese transport system ATP-binding protein/zinc transport system ATP-binding protein